MDKELLPMLPRNTIPQNLPERENECCQENSACCDAEKILAKLYGDQRIARERCLRICAQAKKMNEMELATEIKVFKAVADATRLRILKLLVGGELCICEIMLALEKPQSSVSHNLSILEDAGLIKERKEGKWCLYRISNEAVMDMVGIAGLFNRK